MISGGSYPVQPALTQAINVTWARTAAGAAQMIGQMRSAEAIAAVGLGLKESRAEVLNRSPELDPALFDPLDRFLKGRDLGVSAGEQMAAEVVGETARELAQVVGGWREHDALWRAAVETKAFQRQFQAFELLPKSFRISDVSPLDERIAVDPGHLKKRVEDLLKFGFSEAAAQEFAAVEFRMGFEMRLDREAIAEAARKADGFFHKYETGIPERFWELPPNQIEAVRQLGLAGRELDHAYRRQASPFGATFERVVSELRGLIGGEEAAILWRVYERLAGPFHWLVQNPQDKLRVKGWLPGMEGLDRPLGGGFHPPQIDEETFRRFIPKGSPLDNDGRIMTRFDRDGELQAIPYPKFFADELGRAADFIEAATRHFRKDSGENRPLPALADYLELVARAFRGKEGITFRDIDMARVRLKEAGPFSIVIGAIEQYTDWLADRTHFGLLVMLRDPEEEARFRRYSDAFHDVEEALPVDHRLRYDPETLDPPPVYIGDELGVGGEGLGGPIKWTAVTQPNDPVVKNQAGTYITIQTQPMRARQTNPAVAAFVEKAIDPSQQHSVTDWGGVAFVGNHELGHAHNLRVVLGAGSNIQEGIDPLTYYGAALSGSLEEYVGGDLTSLWTVQYLYAQGTIQEQERDEVFVTYIAKALFALRRGLSGMHARANANIINQLLQEGGIAITEEGVTTVYPDKIHPVIDRLLREAKAAQASGDQERVEELYRHVQYDSNTDRDYHPGMEQVYKELDRRGLPSDNMPLYGAWNAFLNSGRLPE